VNINIIKSAALTWAVLITCFQIYAETINGVVVNGNDTGVPVANAVVSVGYTSVRTTTDSEGRFSLDVGELTAGVIPDVSRKAKVRYYANQRIFDFRQAQSVDQFSIFRLNGTVVLKARLNAEKRTFKVPSLASGIYLVRFSEGPRQITRTWAMSGSNCMFSYGIPRTSVRKSAAAESVKLLLRHDEYFPLDYETFGMTGDLLIGMRPDPRAHVFNPLQVHSYHFTITSEDSLTMERDALLENYIPAQMEFNGDSYGTVGLRYKGSGYSLPNCFDEEGTRADKPECRKFSMKVKFNKYTDATRFYEMKELNLHSMSSDESKMHDMLSYELFRKMGIYSPRTAYIKLYLNGNFKGLFVAVECIDGRFTKSRWPEYGDGNLYKEAWPHKSNEYYYTQRLKTNNDPGESSDASGMVNFYNAINGSSKDDFPLNISSFIDLDYWTRYIAVDRAIQNWDGIMAWYGTSVKYASNHNYFVYEEESPGGKFWLIPWDLDNSLWKNDPFTYDAQVPHWNETPQSCSPMFVWGNTPVIPPACDKLTSLLASTQWDKFVKYGEELLAKWIRPETLKTRIDSYQGIISGVLDNDPVVSNPRWGMEVEKLKRDVNSLHEKFYNYIHGIKPALDTSDYSDPFPGTGYLITNHTNNFEFTPGSSLPFVYSYSSDGTITEVIHNTANPLWGKADLLFNFEFNPIEDNSSHSEWANVGILFDGTTDLAGVKEIHVTMKSDAQRYMSFYISSPVYQDSGADTEYGWTDFYVGTNSRIYIFSIDEISYPSWADADSPDILKEVLASASGLGFAPSARFDGTGELMSAPDTGYLAIDNIKFIFE